MRTVSAHAVLALLIALAITHPAQAQDRTSGAVELQMYRAYGSELAPARSATFHLGHSFGSGWGMQAFGLVSPVFAQALVGATYGGTRGDLLYSVGLMAGFEQGKGAPLRLDGSLWFGYKETSLLVILERGNASGWWYKSVLNRQVNNWLALGIRAERFKGVGPQVQATVPDTPLTLWVTPVAFNYEAPAGKQLGGWLGLRIQF